MHPDDTLFADHARELGRAEAALDGLERALDARYYPAWHLAPRAGWTNDPNGLIYHQGRYHVFFQHHPYGVEWGPMHWGHVSSEDLISWRREPIALAPSIEADREGCWSGSAVTGPDGALWAFYTGHRWAGASDPGAQFELQCLATSADGRTFEKRGVVVDNPARLRNFRDPKVLCHDAHFYMVVGQESRQHRGQVALFASSDLICWEDAGILYESAGEHVTMLECPDLFCIGDKWVLVFSAIGARPQGFAFRNPQNAGYVVGTWVPGKPFVVERAFTMLDWGHNYYAPQSFETPDGRRLQLGWMSTFWRSSPEQKDGWCGLMTAPRELALGADLTLLQHPARELKALFEELETYDTLSVAANERLALAPDLTCGHLSLVLDLTHTAAERAGVLVHETAGQEALYVCYDAQTGCVVADRRSQETGERGYRAAPVRGGASLALDIYLDRSSVEVFVNGGEQVLTERSYPAPGLRSVSLIAEAGAATFENICVRELARGIWRKDWR